MPLGLVATVELPVTGLITAVSPAAAEVEAPTLVPKGSPLGRPWLCMLIQLLEVGMVIGNGVQWI